MDNNQNQEAHMGTRHTYPDLRTWLEGEKVRLRSVTPQDYH